MGNGQGSAGVTLREYEIVGPVGTPPPTGIPAGIVGTAQRGPAFVPVTVGSNSAFGLKFGATDERFGPLAVNEWMTNSGGRAATYLRVLGSGKCTERNENGTVEGAGFVVGSQLPSGTLGGLGSNPFATVGGALGRTYFLGGLMSDTDANLLSSAGLTPLWKSVGSSYEQDVWCRYGINKNGTPADPQDDEFYVANEYSIHVNTFRYSEGTHRSLVGQNFLAENGDVIMGFKAGWNTDPSTTEMLLKFDLGTGENFTPGIVSTKVGGKGSASSDTFTTVGNFVIRVSNDWVKVSKVTSWVAGTGTGTGTGTYTHTGLIPYTGAPISASLPTSTNLTGLVWINKTKLSAWVTSKTPGITGLNFDSVTRTVFTPKDIPDGPYPETYVEWNTLPYAMPILRGVLMAPSGVELSVTNDVDANGEFELTLTGHKNGNVNYTVLTASFDLLNDAYFPNVFNTDPLRIQEAGHYLYAHWDVHPDLAETGTTGAAFLCTGSTARNTGSLGVPNFEDFQDRFSHAVSPWVISQEFGGSPKNLFRLHALDDGAGASTRFKVSIENLVPGKVGIGGGYGTFDLLLRTWGDTDANPVVLESFKGLTLDPRSDKYIARVIGNSYRYFDFDRPEGEQKLIDVIDHPMGSNLVRVEMDKDVDAEEVDPTALPMGFRGVDHINTLNDTLVGAGDYSASIVTPPVPMRLNVAIGSGLGKKANSALYWGAQFEHITDLNNVNVPPRGNNFKDASLASFAKFFPSHREDIANFLVSDGADEYCNNKFSLENVYVVHNSNNIADPKEWENAVYSRDGSAVSGKHRLALADLENSKNRRYGKFTFFMQGGFDGVNIFNEDMAKMTNKAVSEEIHNENRGRIDAGPTARAYVKAIEIMKNTVNGDLQLFAMPGIRNSSITELASDAVRDRFDALYLMDIEQKSALDDGTGNLLEVSERDQDFLEGKKVSVSNTIAAFEERDMDNSFAAAYFPDVVVTDPGTGAAVTVPPSVVVLGAMALNDRVGHPWFAPAGVTRGALGSTIRTKVTLSKANLDALYDAGINPLTPPVAGQPVTVWGQKTLQAGDSALNRVNVRRLLIEIRRQVRDIAQSIIFEPNRASTLARFTAAVTPRLQRIQSLAGLERFRVVIDSSTTTQTDIENNTVRGKIYVQPTKSIEFVSIDFVVTNNAGEQV